MRIGWMIGAAAAAALLGCDGGGGGGPEPIAIPGCTACAPGDVVGGLFMPAIDVWHTRVQLAALDDGRFLRSDGHRLFVHDADLTVERTWSLGLVDEPDRGEDIVAIGADPALDTVALIDRWSADSNELTLRGYDAAGVERWRHPEPALPANHVVVDGDTVYETSAFPTRPVTAYSLRDGSERMHLEGNFQLVAIGGGLIATVSAEPPAGNSPWQFTLQVRDAAGALRWERTSPGLAFRVALAPDGGLELVGLGLGGADLGNGPLPAGLGTYEAVFDAGGTVTSVRSLSTAHSVAYKDMAATGDGIAIAGNFAGELDPGTSAHREDAVTWWTDGSSTRWRALVDGEGDQMVGAVIATDDRVITLVGTYGYVGDLNDRAETNFGTITIPGDGTAFVAYAR